MLRVPKTSLLTGLWPNSGGRKRKLLEASVPETSETKVLRRVFISLILLFMLPTSFYLNTYYMLETQLGARNEIEEKKKKSHPHGAFHLMRDTDGAWMSMT